VKLDLKYSFSDVIKA